MIKKLLSYAFAGAALSAMLVSATQQAHAIGTSPVLTAPGSAPFNDPDCNPAGTVLGGRVVINVIGASSDVTASNSGAYTNRLVWTCARGLPQSFALNGNNTTVFADVVGLCFFGVPVVRAQGILDDI